MSLKKKETFKPNATKEYGIYRQVPRPERLHWCKKCGYDATCSDCISEHPWVNDVEKYAQMLSAQLTIPHVIPECKACYKALQQQLRYLAERAKAAGRPFHSSCCRYSMLIDNDYDISCGFCWDFITKEYKK